MTTEVGHGAAALEVKGLGVRFPGQPQPVLDGVDLRIEHGEFITVVGASGSGKTTLLRAIHGLLPAAAGTVLAGGEQVKGPSRARGFVFQADSLLPWRTVVDNVAYPLELRGVGRRERRAAAHELLELTGLTAAAEKFPRQISGGMRQRANLARALVADPEILLMDEPFAALDAQTREILQAELLSIWGRRRKTVVFVTHQLDEAVYLADRVVVLAANPGRVKQIVPIDLPRPRTLDVKYTSEFAETVNVLWQLIKDDVVQHAQEEKE
ncbi:MAG TPA: ABC transporter ATP-binding protein [Gaiellaceae bacterium]|nr:ABC transporter ATP-binding protein [Gaiellaceae bacterium]